MKKVVMRLKLMIQKCI